MTMIIPPPPGHFGAIVGDVMVCVAVQEPFPGIPRGPDDIVTLARAHENRMLGEAGGLRHRVAVGRDDLDMRMRGMVIAWLRGGSPCADTNSWFNFAHQPLPIRGGLVGQIAHS
jgi:hypothetical protein